MSYNGAKTTTRKHSFKSSAINGRAKGGKKKRNCGHAGGERRKKDEHLKLFYLTKIIKDYKNYIIKTLFKTDFINDFEFLKVCRFFK